MPRNCGPLTSSCRGLKISLLSALFVIATQSVHAQTESVLYTFIGPRGDDCGNLFLKISRLTNYKAFTRIEICWPQLAAFCSAQDDNPG
jgi:hypothetical protein